MTALDTASGTYWRHDSFASARRVEHLVLLIIVVVEDDDAVLTIVKE